MTKLYRAVFLAVMLAYCEAAPHKLVGEKIEQLGKAIQKDTIQIEEEFSNFEAQQSQPKISPNSPSSDDFKEFQSFLNEPLSLFSSTLEPSLTNQEQETSSEQSDYQPNQQQQKHSPTTDTDLTIVPGVNIDQSEYFESEDTKQSDSTTEFNDEDDIFGSYDPAFWSANASASPDSQKPQQNHPLLKPQPETQNLPMPDEDEPEFVDLSADMDDEFSFNEASGIIEGAPWCPSGHVFRHGACRPNK